MTITLIGVGADGDHIRPVPTIRDDGSYEYIPIAESWLTSEKYTYGTFPLQHSEGTAIDIVDKISPFGQDGDWITDDEIIRNHPIHHDPNFEDFTFGDQDGRGGTGSTLRKLTEGDVLGFYAGFDDGDAKNRYLYGYFTVREVADLSDCSGAEYRDRLRQFPNNAHAKRLLGSGKPKHPGGDDGSSLVIIDGREPGGVLDTPVQMTSTMDRTPTYWLTEEFIESFEVTNDLNDETGRYAVDIKNPIHLDLGPEEFRTKLQNFQSGN